MRRIISGFSRPRRGSVDTRARRSGRTSVDLDGELRTAVGRELRGALLARRDHLVLDERMAVLFTSEEEVRSTEPAQAVALALLFVDTYLHGASWLPRALTWPKSSITMITLLGTLGRRHT